MKVLLVNPYICDFTAYDLWLRPLGLYYIAAVLKHYSDCQIFWLDAMDRFQPGLEHKSKPDGRGKFHRETIKKPSIYNKIPRNYARYGLPIELFKEKIHQLPPIDIILITTLMTYWIDGLNLTINLLKAPFPDVKIVVGGMIPTLASETVKENVPADYFVLGPGEDKILKIIQQRGGRTHDSWDFSNLNEIPFPAFEYASNQKWLPLLTSRGCPFGCTYCASKYLNLGFRERGWENINEEIFALKETFNTEHFVFFDDALLINKKNRLFKVLKGIRNLHPIFFHTPNGIHVREIDEETAFYLFENGFKTLRLSFESTESMILDRSANKVNIQEMAQAVRNLEKAGYKLKDIDVYLLFGYPGQKVSDMEKTLWFVRDLGVIPHLAYYSPVPRTKDFTTLQKMGVLSKKTDLYETNKIYFIYEKSGLSHSEIQRIKTLTLEVASKNRQI